MKMDGNSAEKFRFVIVGSGWRSMYYVRIARALPERFELCALLCRTEEKAQRIKEEQKIHTTLSVEECIAAKPDFVVVAVDKAHIASVSEEWLDRGFTVLCETPAGIDMETLERLKKREAKGEKLVVNEQYLCYPEEIAYQKIIAKGRIGKPEYLMLSIAHGYHGESLMHAFLHTDWQEGFTVFAERYGFSGVSTADRYNRFYDGRMSVKERTFARFAFENGTVCIQDFDRDQYRSPIRASFLKLQGERGEIFDHTVSWLDENNLPRCATMEITRRTVRQFLEIPMHYPHNSYSVISCGFSILFDLSK